MAIIYRSDQVMSDPPVGAPVAPGRPSYRDDFSGGDTSSIVGRHTSSAGDLDVGIWGGTTDALAISAGALVKGSAGSGYVGVPLLGTLGAHVTWTVNHRPDSGVAYIDLFRPLSGPTDTYRVLLGTAAVRLQVRVSGVVDTLSDNISYSDGQRVGVRWVGGLLSLFVDGAPRVHVQDSRIAPGGATGIATSTTATGFELDNFQVDIY